MKPYYERGGVTIYHGDARDILPTLGRFDLLLTDPPYGIRAARKDGFGAGVVVHRGGLARGERVQRRDFGDDAWDDAPVASDLLHACRDAAENHLIWGGNYFPLPPSKGILIWDKLRGDTDFADGELAWTNTDRALRIFRYRWNGFLVEKGCKDVREHPTQKPLALMKWCLSLYPKTQSVLDPFMGSGTTLVAAKAAGIRAVGIDAEEKYCEVAARRLSQEVLGFE